MVFITFALPLHAEDLGGTGFEVGILYALFTGAVFLVRPLTGVGLDIVGRKFFFIAAALFYFMANMIYALSDTIEMLYVARLLQGIGFAVLAITADTITSDISAESFRAEAMGGNIASQTRGGMAGAFVGFGLVGAMPLYAWAYSFWIFTITSMAAVIFAIRTLPETHTAKGQKNHVNNGFQAPQGFLSVLMIIFAAAFAVALIQPFYLIYLRERFDLELYMLATAFLPIGVAYAILPGWLGKISGKWRRASVIMIGLTISAVFYAIVPSITSFALIIAAFLAAAIGGVLIDMTKNAWTADLSPSGGTGRTFGLAALASGAGAALGPLAGGAIYDKSGGEILFYAASTIFLSTALLAYLIRRRTR